MDKFSKAVILSPMVVARGDVRHSPFLRLFSESGMDEGAYFPAQDVQIYGADSIKALRDFCDELLKAANPTPVP